MTPAEKSTAQKLLELRKDPKKFFQSFGYWRNEETRQPTRGTRERAAAPRFRALPPLPGAEEALPDGRAQVSASRILHGRLMSHLPPRPELQRPGWV
jgi:hypothetical protein